MYNEQLATGILRTLNEAFPKKMQLNELQTALKEFSDLSQEEWLTAIDALLKYGFVHGVPLRAGSSSVLHGIANLEITTEGRKVLPRFRGAVAQSNPGSNLLFLSHAASDEEIAKVLKEIIETAIPELDVFVSSDPEDLPPGDLWVDTVLKNLASAKVLIVLSTERGLNRRWVWYETGAGWRAQLRIIPCCLGKTRKGQLPAPFSSYQALNIDEETDFRVLLDILGKEFNVAAQMSEVSTLIENLVRLDVRAEERAALKTDTPYAAEMRAQVETALGKLDDGEREAVRLLFLEGQLTDRRAIELVRQKGLLKDNPLFIYIRIASETGLVRRVWSYNQSESVIGYQGPWELNPHLKPILEDYLFRKRPK